MVLLGGLGVDRRLHLREVELHAAELHLALGQTVLLIELAQVEQVQRPRHARLVGVPVEQVERSGIPAHQVVVDEEAPDQVVGSEGVEGPGHGAAGQHAAGAVHRDLDHAQPVLVGEQLQVARIGEVLLRREEGGGRDPLVALRRHVGQGAGHHGSGDAVADRVDLLGPGLLERLLDGDVDALEHVVLEGLVRELGVGVDPGDQEDGEALLGEPAHHRVLGAQVEDVVLVDPGRKDQQRRVEHLFGRRIELQELEQLVLEDDLAGRDGDVLTDMELADVGLADGELAAAAGHIGREVLHAPHQALAFGAQDLLQRGRVRHQEVRWRERVRQHLGEELDAALLLGVGVVDARHQVVQPVGREQVGLLDGVEDGVLAPGWVGESLVAAFGHDHRLCLLASHAPRGRLPEIHVAAEQLRLGLQHLVRL